MSRTTQAVAAIDIGGTKTAVGLVTQAGVVTSELCVETPARSGPDAVLDTAAAAVTQLLADGGPDVLAVGVGSAGVVDHRTGIVRSATNAITGWAGTDLRAGLAERLGLPVAVDNDVRAHAIGECWLGAGAGLSSVLVVAVGTGIGGALILDGRPVRGASQAAGHVGHIVHPLATGIPCCCGGSGHLEAVASGPGIAAMYRQRSGTAVADPREVQRRRATGDPAAAAVITAAAAATGEVIGGLVNVLDPEVVLLAGGLLNLGDQWWTPMAEAVAQATLPATEGVLVRRASLGDAAALVGAARLAWDLVESGTAR